MAAVFQSNVFQNNVFQIGAVAPGHVFQCNVFQNNVFQGVCGVTPPAEQPLYGGWGAGGIVGYRPGLAQRIRRLSELDEPEDKPLFTPEEVLEAAPLGQAERERILNEVLGLFADVADETLRRRLEHRAALDAAMWAAELEQEDELMMMD